MRCFFYFQVNFVIISSHVKDEDDDNDGIPDDLDDDDDGDGVLGLRFSLNYH